MKPIIGQPDRGDRRSEGRKSSRLPHGFRESKDGVRMMSSLGNDSMEPRHSQNSSVARIERAEQVSGLRLIECRYRPDLRMPQHWHDYAHFVLVLEGACTDTCRNSSRRYTLPHLVFYPAGEPHVSHFHGMGARTFEIQMDRE